MGIATPRKIKLGLVGSLLTLTALGLLSFRSLLESVAHERRISHSYQVLERLQGALSELQNAESAQRGYLIAELPEDLARYSGAVSSLRAELQSLHGLTAGDPLQDAATDQLDELMDERIQLLDLTLGALRTSGFEAARQLVEEGRGAEVTGAVRAVVANMERREQELLREGLLQAQAVSLRAGAALLIGTLFAMSLLVAAAVLLNRYILGREGAERQLREARDAADMANRAKSEFLSTVSHEIRTPLNAILGMTELTLSTSLSSEQEELVRTAHVNTEALLLIINDLLDSSKLEAGQVDLEPVPTNLRDLIEGVAEILSVRADVKSLALVTYVSPAVPERVLLDPNRLRQIVMNVVGNAVKFTDQGEVVVRVHAAEGGEGSQHQELHIEVRDTGIGIVKEDRERIFERFVQADGSTGRRFGGTGLGLNISRSLLSLMGGRIDLESQPGRGSCFHIRLPLVSAGNGGSAVLAPEDGVRVLLIDSVESRRELMRATLEDAGMRVQDTGDPAAALQLATGGAFDVIVADEDLVDLLPGTGEEDAPVGPLLVLCRYDSISHRRPRAATEYLHKPVRQARLIDAVERAAGSQKAVPCADAEDLARVSATGERPRILLVEDNPDNSTIGTRILVGAGYDVDLAEDGESAVERARSQRYDLILMDLEMPRMDGFEATRAVRALEAEEQRPRTPIVALTAHAMEGFRERCLAEGMDDYATKPIKQDALTELAGRWVDPRPVLLVVDDAPESHVLIRNYLRGQPYRLVAASDGREALAIYARQRVSAVLLDMDLPVMSGYEVARVIRRSPGGQGVPILAMTGYSGAAERQRCLDAGCTAYLSKPLRRAEVTEMVASLLGEPHAPVPAPGRSEARGASPTDPIGALRRSLTRVQRSLTRGEIAAVRREARALRDLCAGRGETDLARAATELESAARSGDERGVRFWHERLLGTVRGKERIRALHASGLLDSPPEPEFDRLTRLATRVLGVPVAVVSLVDEERQFFKSCVGVGEPWKSARGTPLSYSFCKHAVEQERPLIVEDARLHPLLHENPAIRELDVVAYAGIPLLGPGGHVFGTLCAVDHAPRRWAPEEISTLQDLAAIATAEIQRGRRGVLPTPAETAPAPNDAEPSLRAMTETFLRTRRDEVAEIPELVERGRLAEVARIGHQIHGSAGIFDLEHLGVLGGALSDAARGGSRERVLVLAERLGRAFDLARAVDRREAPPAPVRGDAGAGGVAAPADVEAWREAERRVRRLLLAGNFGEIGNVARALVANARARGVQEVERLGAAIAAAAGAEDAAELRRLSLGLLELLETLQPPE